LDIGTRVLHNTGHGMIYSDGEGFVGRSLDEHYRATGKGELIENEGSWLESTGDMWLSATLINNSNGGNFTGLDYSPHSTNKTYIQLTYGWPKYTS
jgi:hypothetical protein